MSITFQRSTRSLQADSYRRSLAVIVAAAVLLILWSLWFFGARVRVFAVSSEARVEVEQDVHAVEALVNGRVIESTLTLGRTVEQDEVLVKLDSRALKLQRDEELVRIEGLSKQLAVLENELEAEQQVLDDEKGMTSAALAEALAREQEAKATAEFAEEKAHRWKTLASGGVVSGVDGLEAEAESVRRSQEVKALALGRRRLRQERRTKISSQRALLGRLARERTVLQSDIATARSVAEGLQHKMDLHLIRAPVAGRIGEVTPLGIGSVVEAGERLGAVIPSGDVRSVALYSPSDATGRLRPGQLGRLRLDGFPWTQYGSLRVEVTSVASEPQRGKVRVELALTDRESSSIPLEHGLPGTVEIEVERATPAELVLRAAGRLVAPSLSPRGQAASAHQLVPAGATQ